MPLLKKKLVMKNLVSLSLMTFYGNNTTLSEVINVSKDEYRSHKEQLTIQIQFLLNIKHNNKKLV